MRRRTVLVGAVALVGLGGAGAAGVAVERVRAFDSPSRTSRRPPKAATSAVTRQTLTARTEVNGTLGYAGGYRVVNAASGVITALPAPGQHIRRGRILYRVDGEPVVLLYGSTPAYRTLAAGDDASDVTGDDVRQLNANLVALGYAKGLDLDPDEDEFGWRTRQAVRNLQDDLDLKETGKLELGRVVFLPGALRVTKIQAQKGAPAAPGTTILEATSTTRQVVTRLSPAQRAQVKVGDTVEITMPDGKPIAGRVAWIGRVAKTSQDDASDGTKIDVAIRPKDPGATGDLDQAPVRVGITTARVPNVLVVPIESLLALNDGGYAVEVVDGRRRHRLVRVKLGQFDESAGVVQVTDGALTAGQRVVVPST